MNPDTEVRPTPSDAAEQPVENPKVRPENAPAAGAESGPALTGMDATASESTTDTPARRPRRLLVAPTTLPQYGVLILLAVLGLIAFLYFAQVVVVPVALASVAGMALKPLMHFLERIHLPRLLAAVLVLGVLVAVATLGFVRLGQPAMSWVNDAPAHLEQLREKLSAVLRPAAKISQAAAAVANLGSGEESQTAAPTVEVKDKGIANTLFNWTGNLMVGVVETLVLLFLLLASGDQYLPKLVALLPVLHDTRRAVDISRQIQHYISRYLFSISLINLGLGVVVGVGFYFMDLPNPALWGTVAAILNFVPYFGPILGVGVIGMVGLLSYPKLTAGLLPPAWYLVIHLAEANLITPTILGRRFTMSPVVIFISLMFWIWLWGITGALLAVPILVSIKVICERVEALAPVGHLLGGKAARARH